VAYAWGLSAFVAFLGRLGRRTPSEIRPADLDLFTVTALRLPDRSRSGAGAGREEHWPRVETWVGVARRFSRWLVSEGHLLLNPAADLVPVRRRLVVPRVLNRVEVDRLLATTGGTRPVDLRDRALLELAYSSGLRCGELVALDLVDLDLVAGEVQVRRGKGGKARRVPVGPPAVEALTAYLREGRPHFSTADRVIDPHAVFLSRAGTRLCSVLVAKLVRTRARRARLAGRVTTHTLRHSAAVHLLAGGANVRAVQEFLGHADLETTAHYTRLVLTDLKRALAGCHPRRRMRM